MTRAFVLSGGGSLGAVQVGMVRALAERGIEPDLWVGTSVGALNAAYLAGGRWLPDAVAELSTHWSSVKRQDLFPFAPVAGFAGFVGRTNHLVPSRRLEQLVRALVPFERLEEAKVPLHVVATELFSGRERLLSRGSAVDAVMASMAVPGVLPPVPWAGTLLVDGGVANNAPVSHAIALGAREVYVLPAGAACALDRAPSSAIGMIVHALSLMLMRHLLLEIARWRDHAKLVVIPPPCPQPVQPMDFSKGALLVEAGYLAARKHLALVAAGQAEMAPLFGIHEVPRGEDHVGIRG